VNYFRIAAMLAVVGVLVWSGWTVNTWRVDAARAKDLAALNTKETAARVSAEANVKIAEQERDAARAQVRQLETQAREAKTHETVRTIVKKVLVQVPDDSKCDLNAATIELLNHARAPDPAPVSEAPADPPPAATEPEADPGTLWDRINPF
jgi:hypothetical protein